MNKKLLYLIFSIFALLTVYEIINTYGLLETKNKMSVNPSIAKWNVLINGTDIKTGENFTINSVNLSDSVNVLNGKIAPGAFGYFDIEIDPTNTDTSIIYSITFDFSLLSNSFIIDKIEETTSGNLIRTGSSTYSKVITLDEIKENAKNNVRVYIKWENNEENNEIDSQIGLTKDNYINIPVSISAMQYLGDPVDEYIENGE